MVVPFGCGHVYGGGFPIWTCPSWVVHCCLFWESLGSSPFNLLLAAPLSRPAQWDLQSRYLRRRRTETSNFRELSPLDLFCFFPGFMCNRVRKSPQIWRKLPDFLGGGKCVKSCHICGHHSFVQSRYKQIPEKTQETDNHELWRKTNKKPARFGKAPVLAFIQMAVQTSGGPKFRGTS